MKDCMSFILTVLIVVPVSLLLIGDHNIQAQTRSIENLEIMNEEFNEFVGWVYTTGSSPNAAFMSDGTHCEVSKYGESVEDWYGPEAEKALLYNISMEEDFLIDTKFYVKTDHADHGIRVRVSLVDDSGNSVAWMEYKDERVTPGYGKLFMNAEDERIFEWWDPNIFMIPTPFERSLSIVRMGNNWSAYMDGDKESTLFKVPLVNASKIMIWCQKYSTQFAREPWIDYIRVRKGNLTPQDPSGLTIDYTSESENIHLKWDPAGGEMFDGYRIYRSNGSEFIKIAAVDKNTLDFNDSGIPKGYTYSYKICSYNTYSESGFTNEVNHNFITIPGAPINQTYQKSYESINISWEPPEDDGGLNITCFNLYRQNGTNEKFLITTLDGGEEEYEFKDTDITVGNRYQYYISAVNDLGESMLGDGFEVDLFSVPPTPRNLTATLDVDKIIISWNVPLSDTGWGDPHQYRLYRSKDLGNQTLLQEFGPEVLTYEDRGIEENSTYHYSIKNVVDGIESISSEEVEVIVPLSEPVDDDTGDDDIIVEDDDDDSTEEKISFSYVFLTILCSIFGIALLAAIIVVIVFLVTRKRKTIGEE